MGRKKCCENHGLTSNTWEVSWDLSYICLNTEMFFLGLTSCKNGDGMGVEATKVAMFSGC